MKQSLLNAWILALESGTIPQAQDQLGLSNEARCCLGVLCDLIPQVEHRIVLERDIDTDQDIETDKLEYTYGGGADIEALPDGLWQDLGFYDSIGCPIEEANQYPIERSKSAALANLNDSGMSFTYIASRLRREPERYFKSIESDAEPLPPLPE